jgi:ribosomal protein S30
MAHGGIAQAGKVKGCTPKVEKQQSSSKPKTGRAKKRHQCAKLMERTESKTRDGPNKQKKSKIG